MTAADEGDPRHPHTEGDREEPKKPRRRRRKVVPDPATVVAEEDFVSPKGGRYRIVKTRQMDEYDTPPPSEHEEEGGRS